MAQSTNFFTAPLAANGKVDTGWQSMDPAAPYVNVVVASDQSGTLTILAKDADSPNFVTVATIPIIGGNPPVMSQATIKSSLWRMIYTNGATAQNSFSLSAYSNSYSLSGPSDFQLQWSILKELRSISMLLASMKEPTGSTVNLAYGIDPVEPN